MLLNFQNIDKNNTEVNRRKVQIETGQKTIKKLTNVIEESKNEIERLGQEKENLSGKFKEIEKKAFEVKEKYEGIQKVYIFFTLFLCNLVSYMDRSVLLLYDFLYLLQLIDNHKDLLDKAKSDYENMKRTLYELRASEVL